MSSSPSSPPAPARSRGSARSTTSGPRRSTSGPRSAASTASAAARAATSSTSSRRSTMLSFTEAVERLAARIGYQLRYEDDGTGGRARREGTGSRQRLVEANRAAAQYFLEQLAEGGDAGDAMTGRRFLAERGFDRDAAARFGVGFAPRSGEALLRHLRGKGFTEEELVASGLAGRGPARALRPVPRPADLADPGRHRRRRRVRGAPAVRRRPDRGEVPQHPGDRDLQEVAGALRRRPGQEGDRPAAPAGRGRGLHRRDGLPPGRGGDRGRHLRHRVRRRPHPGGCAGCCGDDAIARRGDLHLRR